MKKLKLTQNKVTIIDDEDYEKFNQFKYRIRKNGWGQIYAVRTGPRLNEKRSKDYYLHREIMGVTDRKMQIDHINGNSLDNRKENLRVCTNAQNSRNSKLAKNNTTGYKGVSWSGSKKNKYVAQLHTKGKHIHLGNFDNPIDAALAYNKAAIEYFGEFAKINIIKE